MPAAFIISILIHLMIFLGVFIKSEVKDTLSEPPKQEPIQMQIRERAPAATSELGKDECKSFYFGIGYANGEIYHNLCRVGRVVKNSPAAKAGITDGDLIQSHFDAACPGKGEEGTKITITYHKHFSDPGRTVTITRAKICEDK